MNLKQLKFVVAVSEHSSFSAAAEACFVTQPSLSNGIASLESELGGKLFDRTTRQVSLSDFGRSMMPSIRHVVEGEKEIKRRAETILNAGKSTVRLGVSPLVGSDLSLALMTAFSEQYDSIELVLIEDNLEQLRAGLERGDLDIILVPDTGAQAKGIQKLFIDREPLYFYDRQCSSKSQISIEEMTGKTVLMVPDACGLAIITRELFSNQDLSEYEGRAMSYQVLENWALSGLGAAILPKSKISHAQDQFIPVVRDDQAITIDFCAYWKELPLKGFDNLLSSLYPH